MNIPSFFVIEMMSKPGQSLPAFQTKSLIMKTFSSGKLFWKVKKSFQLQCTLLREEGHLVAATNVMQNPENINIEHFHNFKLKMHYM